MAYREGPREELRCPRCKTRALTPTDLAECACGVWVTAFAAGVVLSEVDRRPDPVLRWWRVREACPVCSEQMTLCGEEPGLLQGCAPHGYWIDADTIAHTKLGGGVDHAAIEAQRSDEQRADAERERLLQIEQEQSRVRAERERAEAQLARSDRDAAATARRVQLEKYSAEGQRVLDEARGRAAENERRNREQREHRPDEGARPRAADDAGRLDEDARVVGDLGHAGRLVLARLAELEQRCARLERENAQLTERMHELEALRRQLEAFVDAALQARS